jgi:hypothetical protein
MKTIPIFGLLLICSLLQAQTFNQATVTSGPSPASYIIGQQGANSRVWQKVIQTKDARGNAVSQTNQAYVELSTGLNFWRNGEWVPSMEEIEISPGGTSAAATNGQHQVYFPGDVYSGAIKLVTPNGQTLVSDPIGLAYYDGTNSVFLAAVTNSTGAILPSGNQVIYTNAFAGLNADLIYTYTKAGMEQDVVLRQQPPDPASLGLNSAQTRLQVLTEFVTAPQATVTATTVQTAAGALEDDSLSFVGMQMGQGKAFLIGANSPSVEVDKKWVVIQGRQFLTEEVPIISLASAIDTLPPYPAQAGTGTKPVISKNVILPPQRHVHTTPKAQFLAQAMPPATGLVLDYEILNSSQTNYCFRGDTTYFISGPLVLYGTNNFEGGTVLKYTNNAMITLGGAAVNWLAGPYRPVIFTAWNDDSVGGTISGSLGNPANNCANPALRILFPTTFNQPISNFRIAYAVQAVWLSGSANYFFYDGQIVNCQYGFYGQGNVRSYLRNMLFSGVQTNFNNLQNATFDVQNATFDSSSYLSTVAGYGFTTMILKFTNCIFANTTALTNNTTATLTYQILGSTNGFYNCPAFGLGQVTNYVYPFQSAGAGNYYLTNACNFCNAGTTNIDQTLLANLQAKTTYSPILFSNVTVSVNTTLNPQAQRDTDTPDLGYHYDPIDYLVDNYGITNATLVLTNGVALASYNDAGILLLDGSSIVSIGTVNYPNWLVRYQSVQEHPVSLSLNGSAPDSGVDVYPYLVNVKPGGQFRFSKFACPANGGYHLYDAFNGAYWMTYSNLWVQDCEFYGGLNIFGGGTNTVVTLKNNLFRRSQFSASGTATNSLILTNNLFWGIGLAGNNPSRFKLVPASGSVWWAFNNDFDTCIINPSDTCSNGYNAYLNCTNYLSPTNSTDIFSTNALAYQTGPFGTFYQPDNSPLLNLGNATAAAVGLYHYTVLTNVFEGYEGNNPVSIGYHYVAVDQYGNPLDSNGDGIPDYLEDANGNGLVDSGEIAWYIIGDLGLKVLITHPRNGSILP